MMYQKQLFSILMTVVVLFGMLASGTVVADPRGYKNDNRLMKRSALLPRAHASRPDRLIRRYRPRTRTGLSSPGINRFAPASSRRFVRRRCSANDVIFKIQQKYKRKGGRVVSIKRGRGGFWVTLQTRRGRVRTFFVRC